MKVNPILTLLLCSFVFSAALSAQRDEVKFGKIDSRDLKMMSLASDSTAEAYVLHDALDLEFVQSPDGGPMLKEYRHRRVKLFTPASFGRADVEIIYNRESDRVSALKGMIHFPNGKSEKLSRSDFIRDSYDDNRDIYKFTFPGVREGAIIEYSYVKTDKFIVIPSRYVYQESIPVRWAEYRALIPAYFKYVSLSTGSSHYAVNKVAIVNGIYAGRNTKHTSILWAMKDLPAYEIQPYINNFSDYLPHVRMQLQFVEYPGQPIQKVFSDWDETTKDMDDWADFGKAYRNNGSSNRVWKDVEPLLAGKTTEEEKAQVIYDFVAGKITWNGNFRWTSEQTPNKVYENARGTSGEMSMLLLALLNQAGIVAKPLLVPLRDGGEPIEIYPLLNQFNHLMVMATLDGKDVILDPNGIHRPMGLPRVSALNHRAFIADPNDPHWVDVNAPRASKAVILSIDLAESGMADIEISGKLESYYGLTARGQLEEMQNDNEFPIVREILKTFPETQLISKEVDESEEVSGPVGLKLKVKAPIGEAVDDYLYVKPILYPVFEEGLADVEQRLYPVDFAFPWQERYVANITIPEGYVVDDLPESQRITSQDNSLSAIFATEDKGNGVVGINFTVAVKRTVYKPNEYAGLREIFRRVIDLQETVLVLKKAE